MCTMTPILHQTLLLWFMACKILLTTLLSLYKRHFEIFGEKRELCITSNYIPKSTTLSFLQSLYKSQNFLFIDQNVTSLRRNLYHSSMSNMIALHTRQMTVEYLRTLQVLAAFGCERFTCHSLLPIQRARTNKIV